MRNILLLRLSQRPAACWRLFPVSVPVGATFSQVVARRLFFFEVVHVHVDSDHEARVMCMKAQFGANSLAIFERALRDTQKPSPVWHEVDCRIDVSYTTWADGAAHHAYHGWAQKEGVK